MEKIYKNFIIFNTETPRSVIKLHSYYKVAGLLACVSMLLSSFPTSYKKDSVSGLINKSSALTVAGAALALDF